MLKDLRAAFASPNRSQSAASAHPDPGLAAPASPVSGNPPSREARLLTGALAVINRFAHEEGDFPLGEIAEGGREPGGARGAALPTAAPSKPPSSGKQPAGGRLAPKAPKSKSDSGPVGGLIPRPAITGNNRKPLRKRFVVDRVHTAELRLVPIEKPQPPVPSLAYGLDRVLFNPGVYHMQDPRSRVYNFDPYLARIMPIEQFDFNALKQYVTSSKDSTLIRTAAEHGKKYTGSTSSMTTTLSHFHYLLSAWRPINPAMLSRDFPIESFNFTRINRAPAAAFLHWKDGTYAIDADKEFDTATILSMLGKSMEKFLTLPKEDFEKYRKTKSDQLSDEERYGPEAYHYTALGDFMMRSQLDAFDPRVPGTGMFDLKTRSVVSIRMESRDFEKGLGYEIRRRFGQWESFEREYYDMIRSAFLKYSLQVRMGRMDGIFVAFHNIERIFGFQYISLPEMDLSLHGTSDTTLGNREFKLSVHLLNKVLDKVTAKFPERSLRLHFETRDTSDPPFMYIFAKPVTPEEIEEVQGAAQASVEEFERRIMGITRHREPDYEEEESSEDAVEGAAEGAVEEAAEEGESEEETSLDIWEDVMHKVESALENEEHGPTSVREAVEDALRQSGLLASASDEETQRRIDAFLEALTTNARSAAPSESQHPGGEEAVTAMAGPGAAADGAAPRSVEDNEQQQGQTPATDGPSDKESTLKETILRLASQLRDMPGEQPPSPGQADARTEDGAAADTQKLVKVVKTLSDLLAQPREPDDAASRQGNGAVERGSLSAEEDAEAEGTSGALPHEKTDTIAEAEPAKEGEEVYGLILTIRNKVNGKYVKRPEKMTRKMRWVVEYAMEEISPLRAQTLYRMVLNRRKKLLKSGIMPEDRWGDLFRQKLANLSKKGRAFRAREITLAKPHPVHVYGAEESYTWESVFENAKDDGTRPYEVWRPRHRDGEDDGGKGLAEDADEDAEVALEGEQAEEDDLGGDVFDEGTEFEEETEVEEETTPEEKTRTEQETKAEHENERNGDGNDENKG